MKIQFHLLATMPSMVVECGLWTDRSEPDLVATGREFVQVFCSCPFEVARGRVRDRERWDTELAVDEYERFRPLVEPLRLAGPLISVATDATVDLAATANAVRSALSQLGMVAVPDVSPLLA